jgi:hypothetical protein
MIHASLPHIRHSFTHLLCRRIRRSSMCSETWIMFSAPICRIVSQRGVDRERSGRRIRPASPFFQAEPHAGVTPPCSDMHHHASDCETFHDLRASEDCLLLLFLSCPLGAYPQDAARAQGGLFQPAIGIPGYPANEKHRSSISS